MLRRAVSRCVAAATVGGASPTRSLASFAGLPPPSAAILEAALASPVVSPLPASALTLDSGLLLPKVGPLVLPGGAPVNSFGSRAGGGSGPVTAADLCEEHTMYAEGEDIAFAWITPRSLIKGLEGGIIARLLAHPSIKLAGARMFSPSNEFVDEYIAIHKKTYKPVPFAPFCQFVEDNLRPAVMEHKHVPNHILFMLFSGKNVRVELSKVVGGECPLRPASAGAGRGGRGVVPCLVGRDGWLCPSAICCLADVVCVPHSLPPPRPPSPPLPADYLPDPRVGMVGRTIRGAYGDFIRGPGGHISHFQPAIVTAGSDEANRQYLRLFSRYLESHGGIFDTYYDRLGTHKNYQTGALARSPLPSSPPASPSPPPHSSPPASAPPRHGDDQARHA